MRRIFCLLLSIVCVVHLTQVALAAEINTSPISKYNTFSFVDSEGKENTLVTTVLESGEIVVENYIEGTFANSSKTMITDNNLVIITTAFANGETMIQEFPVSKYNSSEVSVVSNEEARSSSTYTYAGKIDFLGHQEGYAPGTYHTHTLNMYECLHSITDEYKEINVAAGAAVSTVVGIIASVLVGIAFPQLVATEIAELLFTAAISSVSGTVIGGIVQSHVYKRYYVRCWKYGIQAVDPISGTSKYYYGEEYRVFLEGGGYSSNVQYIGKRNWWTTNVIVLIWPDFWSCGYPGVSSITRV